MQIAGLHRSRTARRYSMRRMFAIAAAIYAFFEYPYYAVDAYVSYCIAANYSLTFMVTLIGAGRPTTDLRPARLSAAKQTFGL